MPGRVPARGSSRRTPRRRGRPSSCCCSLGATSYMRTIDWDHARSCGARSVGTPSSSAMTRTGSGSAYSPTTSKPRGSTSSSRLVARARTRGRSRSTCPRAKAPATSLRNRVWSGGSFSIIWLRCRRLNGSNRSAGCLSLQIRPRCRCRRTALALAWSKVSHMPEGSCHATGMPVTLLCEVRVGVRDHGGSGQVNPCGRHSRSAPWARRRRAGPRPSGALPRP